MKQIILASTSPRRKQLLEKLGFSFKCIKSNFDEKLNPRLKPRGNAEYLSEGKAMAIAGKHDNALIIAADTFICFQDEILGKPESIAAAKRMLKKLSGKSLDVITGFTILDTASKKKVTKSVETKVFMKKLSQRELDGYLATGEPLDSAGGFKIQGKGSALIERIEGDYFAVVGLPVHGLIEELKKFGVYLF